MIIGKMHRSARISKVWAKWYLHTSVILFLMNSKDTSFAAINHRTSFAYRAFKTPWAWPRII